MSKKEFRKFLKQKDAKVKVSAVAVMMIVVALSSVFIFMSGNAAAALGDDVWSNTTSYSIYGWGMDVSTDYCYLSIGTGNKLAVFYDSNGTKKEEIVLDNQPDELLLTADNSSLYVGCTNGVICKYWTSNMTKEWDSSLFFNNDPRFAITANGTYLYGVDRSVDKNVVKIDVSGASPVEIWNITLADGIWSTALDSTENYLYLGFSNASVAKLQISDQSVVWWNTGSNTYRVNSLACDASYVYSASKKIAKMYSSNGTQIWQNDYGDYEAKGVVIDSTYLYVCMSKAVSYQYGRLWQSNGTVNWSKADSGQTYSFIRLKGIYIYVDGGESSSFRLRKVIAKEEEENNYVPYLDSDALNASLTPTLGGYAVTWSGEVSSVVWCNSSGSANEWMQISIKDGAGASDGNATELRIQMTSLNNTGSNINYSTIELFVSSDNSSYGSAGTFSGSTALSNNISLNQSVWNAGTMGTNPFPITGDKIIYVVFKITIPSVIADTYYTWDSSIMSCKIHMCVE